MIPHHPHVGCTGYGPDAARFDMPAGWTRIRTSRRNLEERWDEAGGTAFYWPRGDPALTRGPWVNGIVVFRGGTIGARHGWGYASRDAAGNPLLETAPWPPAPLPLLWHLFAEDAVAPEPER